MSGAPVQDGGTCKNAVNASKCRYCDYHVQSEYRRLKSTRGTLQDSNASGRLSCQAQQAGAPAGGARGVCA